jgi:hypothetical protein
MPGPEKPISIEATALEAGHQKWTMKSPDGTMKALNTPSAMEYAENRVS